MHEQKMRIAICDDDRPIVTSLHERIETLMIKWSINAKIYDFSDSEDLLYEIESTGIFDIIFLDIEIGKVNGIDLASELRSKYFIFTLIFISQYDNYYRAAFEVQPFWFLDKPFSDEKLELAMKKAVDREMNKEETFDFSFNKVYYRIFLDDIVYFESDRRQVLVHCVDNKIYRCYNKLNMIEQEFRSKNRNFIRIHRSFYVNQIYIKKYYYDRILLHNDEEIQISASRREEVRDIYINTLEKKVTLE